MNYVKTYKDIQRYTETTQLDIPSFGVDVTQDIPHQYNIKDNPEAFRINIINP